MKRITTICMAMTMIFFLGNTAFAGSGGKHLLRYNPEAGKTGTIVMDYTMNIGMDFMGQTMDIDQQMEMGAKLNVLENTAEAVTSEFKYDYFAMTMNNPMTGEIKYDSRVASTPGDPFASVMDSAMNEMMTTSVKMVMDHSGHMLSMEGIDGIMSSQKTNGGLNLGSVLGMSSFPDKPVEVGSKWTSVIDDINSPMKFDITMTLKAVKEGKVYMEFTSDVSSNKNFVTDVEELEGVDLGISGKQNGTFVYEQKTMWMLEGMIHQDLKMTVSQMGMDIPMKVMGDMVLTME